MMKYITMFEKNIPKPTSRAEWRSSSFGRAQTIRQPPPSHGNVFFHILIRLPRVEVSRKRSPDHRDQHRQKIFVELNRRNQRAAKGRQQLRLRQKCRPDIGQQRQGQPAEDIADQRVRSPDLQAEDGERNPDDDPADRNREQQIQRCRHAADIGSGFDDVADDRRDQKEVQNGPRVVFADDRE